MRRLIFNLHLYFALIASLFVFILGITGGVMAFETELSDLFHAKLVYVSPGTNLISLAEISNIVSKAFPAEKIKGYNIATSPNHSYGAVLSGKTVHVDPYTGAILGTHFRPDRADVFLSKVHQLHLRLLVTDKADSGKQIIRWSCVVLILLLVSGGYLWWPGKKITVQWKGRDSLGSRSFWYDLHNTVGIFSLIVVLALAITGVAIGFQRQAEGLFSRMTHSQSVYPPNVRVTPPQNGQRISPDEALAIARAALPGVAPFDLTLPGPAGAYDFRARFPEDLTGGGRSRILVDQYSGTVIFALSSRTAPAGQRMIIWNRALHTGDIFGMPSKVVMSLASFALALQVASGVIMWWKRVRKVSI